MTHDNGAYDKFPHCQHCGSLDWTVKLYGRVTHKESCPNRQDEFHQGYPLADMREDVARQIWAWWQLQPTDSGFPRISWDEAKHPQIKAAKETYEVADVALREVSRQWQLRKVQDDHAR